ncbi:acyl-CoA dehydrogenase family protein [Nocardioides panaciterrulae]|uniref:Alkylation response protein AidB-like acyl-CoA dehydrogenase n=1 Tax=Nocardioides panaciterrulae TaxID=661492 RepID=A0A7Y9JBY1_9ACTN|nr:alkylation response protein AidB-like acyl-CoA dehydrogenase [Nocardioides panaciterrulae]
MPDESPSPVVLRPEPGLVTASLGFVAEAARAAADDLPAAAVELARTWGSRLPLPGRGATTELWEALATVAATDLSVARIMEPHVDALAILAESGAPAPDEDTSWGVYAAEGPGARLEAREHGEGWRLAGLKPWCSLAGDLTHALVTAWVDDSHRGLFAVDLRHPGVEPLEGTWHARGLREVRSGPVRFTDVPAGAVGAPGWYLQRDGFAWGGMGVAAIWYGGAVGVARRLLQAARERTPDQVALMHLGTVDAALAAARSALVEAALRVDEGAAGGQTGALLALRLRHVVADAAERVLTAVDHGLGPGPLSLEPVHAGRVADLRLYLRQHHAERDAAALGARLVEDLPAEGSPW